MKNIVIIGETQFLCGKNITVREISVSEILLIR